MDNNIQLYEKFSGKGGFDEGSVAIRQDDAARNPQSSHDTVNPEFTPCIIVPFYNHGQFAELLLDGLLPYSLPLIIVDDGSNETHKNLLNQTLAQRECNNVTLITLPENGGKGSAVIAGFHRAHELGFTHAIQIDADCQHDFSVIPAFLQASSAQPAAMICGYPIYDETVPRSRLYPRYITHFWVWVHTLSRDIRDSMCGFRVYPLRTTLGMLARNRMGKHMDFDIEVVVRLYWAGLSMVNLPVGVIYHQDASSHFRLWADNVLITKAHTLLFFGMLKHLPRRLLTGKFA